MCVSYNILSAAMMLNVAHGQNEFDTPDLEERRKPVSSARRQCIRPLAHLLSRDILLSLICTNNDIVK